MNNDTIVTKVLILVLANISTAVLDSHCLKMLMVWRPFFNLVVELVWDRRERGLHLS